MNQRQLIATAAASTLLIGGASAANLIVNGDFETTGNWNFIGNAPPSPIVEISTLDPEAGTSHGRISYDNLNNLTAGGGPVLQQVGNGVSDTMTYNLSFDAKLDTLDLAGVNVQLGLFLGGNTPLGTPFISLTPGIGTGQTLTTEYQTFTFNGLVAGNANDVFDLQFLAAYGPVDDIVNALNVDNVVLDAVPEPASLGLLGLGALAGLTRRRRV